MSNPLDQLGDPTGASQEAPKVRRKPGPKPGQKRQALAQRQPEPEAQLQPVRRATRQASREPARDTNRIDPRAGAMVVTGRNGEQLTRRRAAIGDQYYVPPNEIPTGWDYQWNQVTVLNEEQVQAQNQMYENGWRPVPASRHPGRWTKPGYEGAIIVDGLRLEERPLELTKEALNEGVDRARAQVRNQADALMLSKKMPEGFAAGGKYRGTGAQVRMQIDRGLDIAPGGYLEADDSV